MSSKSQNGQSDLGAFHIKKDSLEQSLQVGSLFKRSRESEELGSKKFKGEELNASTSKDNIPCTCKHVDSKTQEKADGCGELMKHVVFVLSGFQNPERSELRDTAKRMGAVYSSDWNGACTHLICAFRNTPKYRQVRGHACIVSKEWLLECSKQQKLLSEWRFKLGKMPEKINEDEDEEEEEDLSDDDDFVVGDDEIDYDSEDDDDDANIEKNCVKKVVEGDSEKFSDDYERMLKEGYRLKEVFGGINFFIYGTFSSSQTHFLHRYITAYGGVVRDYMGDDVHVVMTDVPWDCNFDEAVRDNKDLKFLKVEWLVHCINQQKLLPFSPQVLKP